MLTRLRPQHRSAIRNPDTGLQDLANIAAAGTSQILPPLARQQ